MASMFRKHTLLPVPMGKSAFELLQQLPPEVLDRILFVYCDGKALSTLAVAVSTSLLDFYSNIADKVIPTISKRLLLRIIDEIESNSINGFKHVGAIRWIRLIAADTDCDMNGSLTIDHSIIRANHDQSRTCNTTDRSETISELRSQKVKSRRKRIRYCSENFAVVDFLRRSMVESQHGKWEWPVWVGQISVSVHVDATVARSMTYIEILAPLDFPSHIPGSSLLYRHRTPTSLFRCEPMNMIPVPPWGRLRGLTANDNVALNRIAVRLEEAGQSHVVVPTRNQEHDPLNIRILRKTDARLRIIDAAPRFGPNMTETLTWLIHDEAGDIDVDRATPNPFELVCCWENDTLDEILPREYIEYIIMLMKTRDRLVKESITESHRRLNGAVLGSTNGSSNA